MALFDDLVDSPTAVLEPPPQKAAPAGGMFPDLAEPDKPEIVPPEITEPAEPTKPLAPPISPAGLIARPAVEAAKGLVRGTEAHVIGGLGSMAQWAVESPFVKTADPGAAITDIATRWGPDWLQTFAQKMQRQGVEKQVAKQAENWADWWEEQANKGWEAPSPEVAQAKWKEMPITKAAAVIGEAAPSYLSAIVASVLTKNPKVGLLFLSGQVGAGAYRRQRKAGAGIPKANLIALMTGAWEYVTEKIPFEEVFKPSQHLFRKMLKIGTYESAQEFVQGIGENFLEYFGYEAKDLASVPAAVKEGLQHSLDGWFENIVAGFGLGVIGGAAGQAIVGKPPTERAEPPKPLGLIPVEPRMPAEQMREEYERGELEPAPVIPQPTPVRPMPMQPPLETREAPPVTPERPIKPAEKVEKPTKPVVFKEVTEKPEIVEEKGREIKPPAEAKTPAEPTVAEGKVEAWKLTDEQFKTEKWPDYPEATLLPSEYAEVAKHEGELARDLVYELNQAGIATVDTHKTENKIIIQVGKSNASAEEVKAFADKHNAKIKVLQRGAYIHIPAKPPVAPEAKPAVEEKPAKAEQLAIAKGKKLSFKTKKPVYVYERTGEFAGLYAVTIRPPAKGKYTKILPLKAGEIRHAVIEEIKVPAEKEKISLTPEQEQQAKKLRQQIHAIAVPKGLTKKAVSELKLKHTGYRHLTGKIAQKKITIEQLQDLLKAVQKARPRIDAATKKRVITLKTEKKIQSLKENLIKKVQMTEAAYAEVLQKEIQGRQPKYIDSKNFITETQGKALIRRMHDTAEVLRITEPYERAIRDNSNIADEVKTLDQKIAKAPKRDPHSLESMRYYNQQAQQKTGAPVFYVYQDLIDTHLDNSKTRTATLHKLTSGEFKKVAKDKDALQRVSDYIASQSTLKGRPESPADITPEEIGLAKKIQAVLEEYRLKVRTAKFFNWYYYQQPIPDHDQYRKEITKAVDIYDSKGQDELIEYLKTQKWGVIKSGYEPLEVLFQKIRPYRMKPTTVGKGHIKIRTDIEYHPQERTILQRLSSYMRQMDMLSNLSPKINAYVRLYDDNMSKFNRPEIVRQNIEIFLQNLKRYNIQRGWFERQIARAYAQAMQVIIMPSPALSFRNLFQPVGFEHDKSILIDPRNKKLTDEDIDYLETYVLQTRMMVEEYFMVGEKPLPGLKFLTKLVNKIKIYPYSDIANRHWSFWAKKNQVNRALEAKTTKKMMQQAKFNDMTELEQRRALGILAKDGKDAMARYVARTHVDDIHFLYERSQRSPAEMGGVGRIMANLMLFPRAYTEKLAHATSKVMNKKSDFPTRYRGLKILFTVIAGGMLCGALYKKITGRRKNPYDPLELLSYEAGGLAWSAVESVNQVYINMLLALKGDSRAMAALTTAIPETADMFIPFYNYVLRGIEAATDQKNVDKKVLRQLRMLVDKEYKVRGGAYKLERNALEKWQYFIAGAGVDVGIKERQKKPKPIRRIKPMQRIERVKRSR